MAEVLDFIDRKDPNAPWYKQLAEYTTIPLWPDGAPGFDSALNQPAPSFAFFRAPGGEGKGCVVVMAGGGYTFKSTSEGIVVAKKLNLAGINAAVLDYRIVPYSKDLIVGDAKRCIRYLRCHADEYGINPEKIGVMGFSAGGNLAAMTGFLGDDGDAASSDPVERCSSRPNAAVLAYAAVVLKEELEEPDDDDEFDLFTYFDFKPEPDMQFPPAFIWQSFEDMLINYRIAFELADLLRKKKVPVELHIFPYGEHGQALSDHIDYDKPADSHFHPLTICWSDLCVRWLHYYGF